MRDGFVKAITCIEMELGEPDASGRRRPIEKKGSEFTMDVDTVIMSLGTSPNPLIRSTTPGLETNKHGCIVTEGDEGKTSREGVYAGGDAVTGAATVIKAMGAGKAAAKAIDEYIAEQVIRNFSVEQHPETLQRAFRVLFCFDSGSVCTLLRQNPPA